LVAPEKEIGFEGIIFPVVLSLYLSVPRAFNAPSIEK